MDRVTYEPATSTFIPPAQLCKSCVDYLIPTVAPHAIQKTEILYGDGGPGTIKEITFGEGSHCKFRVDKVDDANLKYGFSLIEGDALWEVLEKISYEFTFVPYPYGGCLLKRTKKLYFKGDNEIKDITKNQVKSGKKKVA